MFKFHLCSVYFQMQHGICVANMKSRGKARNLHIYALKTRSSKKVCAERLACKGSKPQSTYQCEECGSFQCYLCEALLHEDVRLAYHTRKIVADAPEELICDGGCEDRNFADVTCCNCLAKYCYACDRKVHSIVHKKTHVRSKFRLEDEEFLSCEGSQQFGDKEFVEENMMYSVNMQGSHDFVDLSSDFDSASSGCEGSTVSNLEIDGANSSVAMVSDKPSSFQLLDKNNKLQVQSAEDFVKLLGCAKNQKFRVVSLFGNPKDGKSSALNNTFFDGNEVFETSKHPLSYTDGIWASYCAEFQLLILDTGSIRQQSSSSISIPTSTCPDPELPLMEKVMTISDVVIYRTLDEVVDRDLVKFLRKLSAAHVRFNMGEALLEDTEVESHIRQGFSTQSLIVFHEEHKSSIHKDAKKAILEKCKLQGVTLKSVKFQHIAADFFDKDNLAKTLRETVLNHITGKEPHTAEMIFNRLQKLEAQVQVENVEQPPTCSAHCLSCNARCTGSQNHKSSDSVHQSPSPCSFLPHLNNKDFLCKACIKDDRRLHCRTSRSGFTYYNVLHALKATPIWCPDCGELNKDMVVEEIKHVWPQDSKKSPTNHTGQKLIDGITVASDVISSAIGPVKALSTWAVDQVKATLMSGSEVCYTCKEDISNKEKVMCRICENIFCLACAPLALTTNQGGLESSRVCDECLVKKQIPPEPTLSATALRTGETIWQLTMELAKSAVASGLEIVKDSARPEDWVPDKDLIYCHRCKVKFSDEVRKHHCRQCGQGVCDTCSPVRVAVPEKGWHNPVRVCITCNERHASASS